MKRSNKNNSRVVFDKMIRKRALIREMENVKSSKPQLDEDSGRNHQIWTDWFQASSFHGVVDLSKTGYGKCWKGAWIFLIVTFSAMTVYTVEQSIEEFVRCPTVQTYKQEPVSAFVMPDLVICARQIYNVSKLKQMGASDRLIDGLLARGDGFADILDAFSNSSLGSYENSTAPPDREEQRKKEYEIFLERNGRPTFDDVLRRASVDCEKMVQYCSWTRNCCAQAASVFDYRYGHCYRISPGRNVSQHYPGSGSGVQLVARGSFNHDVPMKNKVIKGILIDIVYPNQWMMYNYQQIPTGVAATVLLSLQKTERINLPGRAPRCREKKATDSHTYENTIDSLKSTTNGCFYAAWAYAHNKYCNCTPLPGINSSGAGRQALGSTCHPFTDCSIGYTNDSVFKLTVKRQASCLPECNHYDYKTWITYGKFDSSVYRRTRGTNVSLANDSDDDSSLLDIYHPVMECVNVKEVQTYTVFTLLANIGGAAGLWLGSSLMSFFQFGFYFAKWLSLRLSQ